MWYSPHQHSNNYIIKAYSTIFGHYGPTSSADTKKKWRGIITTSVSILLLVVLFMIIISSYYYKFTLHNSGDIKNNNNINNYGLSDVATFPNPNLQRIPLSDTTTSTEHQQQKEEQEDGEGICDPSLGCQEDANKLILIFLAIFFVSIILFYILSSIKIHYLPESTMIIVYGAIIGLVGRFVNVGVIKHVTTFSSEMFFLFLLPGIIFETGFTLSRKHFFKNILPILLLATIGTFITFFGVGIGLYLFGKFGISFELPMFDSFLLSSITCATDPVATLGIFNALDVDPRLFIIVLGESIFNDAASLILFHAVDGYTGPNDIWISALLFIGVSLGSVALGFAISLLSSIILKVLHLDKHPTQELLIILIFSYASYSLADAIHLSGILSTFVCGMTFGHYGIHNLTSEGQLIARQFLRLLAFAFEIITFIYIGITLSMYSYSSQAFSWSLFIWLIVLSIVTRVASVLPIIGALNHFKLASIGMPIQLIISLSGLRGAISFSLVLSGSFSSDYTPYIKEHVLLLVYFTIFVFGGSTYPALKALRLDKTQFDTASNDATPSSTSTTSTLDRFISYYHYLDQKYFIRWLTKNYQITPEKHSDIDQNEEYGIESDKSTHSSASTIDFNDDSQVEMVIISK